MEELSFKNKVICIKNKNSSSQEEFLKHLEIIMNKFSFHPIGQGLFYTGSILNGFYNFVYDCGTESISNNLDISIENYTNELSHQKSDLDMIVISHLHDDHINGIYKLINACRNKKIRIKKIVLPFLYGFKNVALASIINSLNIGENNSQNEGIYQSLYLINNLYNDSNNFDIDVDFLMEEDYNKDNIDEDLFIEKDFVIPSLSKKYWNFHLFNKTIKYSKCKMLNDEINRLLTSNNMQDIISYVQCFGKAGVIEIKKIYEAIIVGDLNVTSTILLHYPTYKNSNTYLTDYKYFDVINYYKKIFFSCCNFYYDYKVSKSQANMTLLTGDAKFIKKMINHIENLIKDNNCILQVPHHGSYQNWNSINKANINFAEYIIPFGLGNGHNHPSGNTIEEIVAKANNVNCIYEVNQLKGLYYCII